jgi:hypothetical protein
MNFLERFFEGMLAIIVLFIAFAFGMIILIIPFVLAGYYSSDWWLLLYIPIIAFLATITDN